MKRFLKNRLRIVWCFVVSALLTVVCDGVYQWTNHQKFSIYNFETELNRQHIFLEASAIKLAAQIASQPEQIWATLSKQDASEYSFLAYKDTALVGWTSQLLPVGSLSHKDFENPIVRLSSGWYLSACSVQGGYKVVGLFQIKSEYSYENKYVANQFASCFDITNDAVISRKPIPGGHFVHDGSRNILCSLYVPGDELQSQFWGILSLIFLVFTIAFLMVVVSQWLAAMASKRRVNWAVIGIAIFVVPLHYILFASGIYHSIGTTDIFSPLYFAYSSWFSSIGSYLMAAFFAAWIAFLYYRHFVSPPLKHRPNIGLRFVAVLMVVLALFWMLNHAVFILIEHSTDVYLFRRIVDINIIAILKLCALFLLFLAFSLVLDRFIGRYIQVLTFKFVLISVSVVCVAGALVSLWGSWGLDWSNFLFFEIVVLFMAFQRQRSRFEYSYRHLLWLVLLFDLYAVLLIFKYNVDKEKDNRQFLIEILASNLAGEQDAVAEMYLSGNEDNLASDVNVMDMIENGALSEEELRQYLMKNYFFGYLGRYDIQVVPCWPRANLFIDGTNQSYDCYRYFDDMLNKYGEPLTDSKHYYFLRKENGRVNYFGVFKFFQGKPGLETSLYIEFNSKPFFEGLGYPELLISQKEQIKLDLLKDYSYAQYVDGHLVKRSGEYLYKVDSQQFVDNSGNEKYYVDKKGYSHLIYQSRGNNIVVMSYPTVTLSNILMAFSVIYLLFLSLLFILFYVTRWGRNVRAIKYSIQERIQIAMVSFSVVLMLAIGVSSVVYAVYQNKSKNYDMLSQRLKSVLLEMDQKIGTESKLTPDMTEYLNFLLQNFSNIFYSDINMYGLDGKLLATSRSELYQKGVMGNLINPDAYNALSVKGEREFIHNESIGDLDYISAYVPFLNQRNEVLAYVNLPYFVGNNQLREEISSILVAMVNAYLVFILVAIGIALLASRQITRPLLIIQERLSQTRLGLKNEKIEYARADEIGHLVDEYNRMVEELAMSADKLARSERELAWREMAKQIAHEIKNPLTPMQLSVQYLQKAWDDKVPDFDVLMKRVSKTLIDQIQQLSVIATEFSHFAKMPAAKRERVDIVEKLLNTIALYEKTENVQFKVNLNGNDQLFVLIDGEQILSVYNNLIKNGIQSVQSGKEGVISIQVQLLKNNVILSFADNGRGIMPHIKEKLFTPNFTTKSSGMGLGLAIVKNIVEGAEGKIWFETEVGKGSVFYISLPWSETL